MTKHGVFDASHAWDRNFFLLFVLLCWLAVLMGFEPAVTDRFNGKADYGAPLILQVHVFAFAGWLSLLTLQILLIRFRRFSVHRTLGLIGFVLIPVMTVSAIWSELYSQRFYSGQDPGNLRFFIFPIMTILVFTVLAFTALGFRKQSSFHKRLILLATVSIVGSAFYRWWGDSLAEVLDEGYLGTVFEFYTGYFVLLVLAVGYDVISRKQIHPVYKYAAPLMTIIPFIVSGIYHSAWWPELARSFVGL